ncbi:MAG: hypothetical protein JWP64_5081 [Pseudonocardia sp.]|nr:hypothetical protein [Pseudonocardia sp.]
MFVRFSTTVTLVPSAANIEAYSMPMTPAPTTTIEVGTRLSLTTASESTTWYSSSSNSTSGGRAGRVPVAITILSAVTVLWSPRAAPCTVTVCGSSNWAVPPRMSTCCA